MKHFWNYIENHAWAQWTAITALWLAFFAIIVTVYPMVHDGETIQESVSAWVQQ